MKFKDVYKSSMDQVVVPQKAVDNVISHNSFVEQLNTRQKKGRKIQHLKRNLVIVCLALLCILGFYNINNLRVFATSVLKTYEIDLGWKRAELGELAPYKLDLESFMKLKNVKIDDFGNGDVSYSKTYQNTIELKKETGISMISSKLLTVESGVGGGVFVIFTPKYKFGKLNGSFDYKNQMIGIDSVFALEGGDESSIGYGNGSDERYDFTYKAKNGIKAYFIKSKPYKSKAFFRAGDIVYQIVSNEASVEDMKIIIDSFVY